MQKPEHNFIAMCRRGCRMLWNPDKLMSRCLLFLWLGCIWGHSMMSVSVSAQESGSLLQYLIQFLPFLTDHILRKMAHVFEYFILGLLVSRNVDSNVRGWEHRAEGICFVTAFLDESIQVFSGRGALVTDVWIDLGGAILGIAVYWLLSRRRA